MCSSTGLHERRFRVRTHEQDLAAAVQARGRRRGDFREALAGTAEAVVMVTLASTALLTACIALSASVLHLGRPQFAWKAVIGLRHSWLSREIVAFGVFALLASLYAWVLLAGQEEKNAAAFSAGGDLI
jgi:DMSO reductase anchor subunit